MVKKLHFTTKSVLLKNNTMLAELMKFNKKELLWISNNKKKQMNLFEVCRLENEYCICDEKIKKII